MVAALEFPATVASALAAAACVVAGGPLFADGLRALRVRRALRTLRVLRADALDPDASGLVQVRGRVALESPLFSPLSARPCAGYALDVRGVGTRVGGRVLERRAFRLVTPSGELRVAAEAGEWAPPVTAERALAPGEAASEGLEALLERVPEARALRLRGATLALTERAFESGAAAWVTGYARHARAAGAVEARRLAATGTDGAAGIPAEPADRPWFSIEPGESPGLLIVSDRAPGASSLAPAGWRTWLAFAGPALTLAGLVQLARIAGSWLDAGRA